MVITGFLTSGVSWIGMGDGRQGDDPEQKRHQHR